MVSQVHNEKVVHAVDTFQNKQTTPMRATESQNSAFEITKTVPAAQSGNREKRAPVTLESEAVYEGEWLNELRDGHGK